MVWCVHSEGVDGRYDPHEVNVIKGSSEPFFVRTSIVVTHFVTRGASVFSPRDVFVVIISSS